MKYVSLAVITTGLDVSKNDVLEVSAIIEDTRKQQSLSDCPKLHLWIDKEFYRGSPDMLIKYNHVMGRICKLRKNFSKNLINPDEVTMHFTKFLQPHFSEHAKFTKQINVAGFRLATQVIPFLDKFPNFKNIPINLNILEVSNFFFNWAEDSKPPTLNECAKRCGIVSLASLETHTSLDLAWNNIQILRTKYSALKGLPQRIVDVPKEFASVISSNIKEMLK